MRKGEPTDASPSGFVANKSFFSAEIGSRNASLREWPIECKYSSAGLRHVPARSADPNGIGVPGRLQRELRSKVFDGRWRTWRNQLN